MRIGDLAERAERAVAVIEHRRLLEQLDGGPAGNFVVFAMLTDAPGLMRVPNGVVTSSRAHALRRGRKTTPSGSGRLDQGGSAEIQSRTAPLPTGSSSFGPFGGMRAMSSVIIRM